jgi:hypothetical protein
MPQHEEAFVTILGAHVALGYRILCSAGRAKRLRLGVGRIRQINGSTEMVAALLDTIFNKEAANGRFHR